MSYYALSDLHGNYKIWNKVKDFLKEDDTLFYLGDACDRGQYGIEIMQELLADKRVIYLKGNHEQMFLDATRTKTDDNFYDIQHSELLWRYNGGQPTIEGLAKLSLEERRKLRMQIAQLPIYVTYKNEEYKIILCHSGLSSEQLLMEIYKNSDNIDENLYIWNREHIQEQRWYYADDIKDIYIVHGHTPVSVLNQFNLAIKNNENDKFYQYCNDHKIDIDMGTYVTHTGCLLNLDTLKAHYFKGGE